MMPTSSVVCACDAPAVNATVTSAMRAATNPLPNQDGVLYGACFPVLAGDEAMGLPLVRAKPLVTCYPNAPAGCEQEASMDADVMAQHRRHEVAVDVSARLQSNCNGLGRQ